MKTFDELMSDARDAKPFAKEWCDKYSSPGDFEEFGQQEALMAGHRAAMDRMEPALREAVKAFEDIQDDAEGVTDFGNNQTKKRIAGLCLSKIRALLAKGEG